MHEVLVNRLGGLSLPRKSVIRLTDRPDTTLDVYRGRKTTMQQQHAGFQLTGEQCQLRHDVGDIVESHGLFEVIYSHVTSCGSV